MQWLFDIVEEMMEAAGFLKAAFVDRGDPAVPDWIRANLTLDGAFHELDASGIVPAGATAILMLVQAQNLAANQHIQLRAKAKNNAQVASFVRTQIALITVDNDVSFAIGTDRIIKYNASATNWTIMDLTIKGWWL